MTTVTGSEHLFVSSPHHYVKSYILTPHRVSVTDLSDNMEQILRSRDRKQSRYSHWRLNRWTVPAASWTTSCHFLVFQQLLNVFFPEWLRLHIFSWDEEIGCPLREHKLNLDSPFVSSRFPVWRLRVPDSEVRKRSSRLRSQGERWKLRVDPRLTFSFQPVEEVFCEAASLLRPPSTPLRLFCTLRKDETQSHSTSFMEERRRQTWAEMENSCCGDWNKEREKQNAEVRS